MDPTSERVRSGYVMAVGLLTAVAALLVYIPSLSNGFVSWDDPVYIYENINIRAIDPGFIAYALGSLVLGNWHPLTIISHAIDFSIWGLNPFGHHLTGAVIHSINTLLVFFVSLRLLKSAVSRGRSGEEATDGFDKRTVYGAAVTALFFGLHPLRVESVAWASERKDLLSALFYLLALLSYIRYAVSGRIRSYVGSLIFMVLSLLSKPMAVSLPFALFILDLYPFKRFGNLEKRLTKSQIIIEKAPFLLLAIIFSLVALYAQSKAGAIRGDEIYPFAVRAAVAAKGCLFYLYKTVIPTGLAPLYPYPEDASFSSLQYSGSAVLLALITLGSLSVRKKYPYIAAAWLYFLITIIPVLGLVQVGSQAAADRYTYLPLLGPTILIGALLGSLIAGLREFLWLKKPAFLTAGTICVILSILTILQTRVWSDTLTLWTHEISIYRDEDATPYNNRGESYMTKGQLNEAMDDFKKAIEIDPKKYGAHNNMGLLYMRRNAVGPALESFNEAIYIYPRYMEAYNNRGLLYSRIGRVVEAVSNFTTAIELAPDNPEPYNNRGMVLMQIRKHDDALMDFNRALELNPYYTDAYNNRGMLSEAKGKYGKAISDFTIAIELSPDSADAYNNRGATFINMGMYMDGIEDLEEAVRLEPSNEMSYRNIAIAYSKLGDGTMAEEYFKKAHELETR